MTTGYERLFESLRLGPLVLSNRITMTPMCLRYANEDGSAGEVLRRHYREMGASGAALVVTEHTCVDAPVGGSTRMLRSDEERFLPELAGVAAAIREGGALAGCQINHLGRYADTETPLAPSVFVSPLCHHSRGMTEEDMHHVTGRFAAAARRVREAGFDSVELHGGRGYLLMQFLSPYTNRRMDEYGGNLANRMRFPLAVVRAVREAVDGFPVGYRLTADEWLPGGFGPEEAARFAAELAGAGVTYISVMAGSNESPLLNPDYQRLAARECYAAGMAKLIKEKVNIPVIVAGRITTPAVAEELLARGCADLIGLARGLLRDPLWPRKAREGNGEGIDICDNCSSCTSYLLRGEPGICPRREKEHSRRPGM